MCTETESYCTESQMPVEMLKYSILLYFPEKMVSLSPSLSLSLSPFLLDEKQPFEAVFFLRF